MHGYDYSLAGAYYVTQCVESRLCVLGEIIDEQAVLFPPGEMVQYWLCEVTNKFASVELDEFVVMPNHMHGILVIVDYDVTRPSLGTVMGWFKTMSTNAYIRGVKESGWSPFTGHFRQRDYFDRIIRNDLELERAREYIRMNPARWVDDKNNPKNSRTGPS